MCNLYKLAVEQHNHAHSNQIEQAHVQASKVLRQVLLVLTVFMLHLARCGVPTRRESTTSERCTQDIGATKADTCASCGA